MAKKATIYLETTINGGRTWQPVRSGRFTKRFYIDGLDIFIGKKAQVGSAFLVKRPSMATLTEKVASKAEGKNRLAAVGARAVLGQLSRVFGYADAVLTNLAKKHPATVNAFAIRYAISIDES